jgi:hypothetical protein
LGGGGSGTPEENGRAPAENSGAGSAPTNEEDDVQRQVNDLWQRRDAGKWTEELRRAHGAFERGKGWGIEWASLVDRFFDFEATWGYADAGGQIMIDGRPKAVEHWIGRARKWEKTIEIGVLGDAKKVGSFVASWWGWWVKVQPSDRSDLAPVLRLHGKNGLLQMMASLLWWGERVADGTPADVRDWSSAVEDVADLLTEMLRPGVIAKL